MSCLMDYLAKHSYYQVWEFYINLVLINSHMGRSEILLIIFFFLLGSGQRHVQTSWVVQEANSLVLVGSHA